MLTVKSPLAGHYQLKRGLPRLVTAWVDPGQDSEHHRNRSGWKVVLVWMLTLHIFVLG